MIGAKMRRPFILSVLLLVILAGGCLYNPAPTENVPVTGWDSGVYGTAISSPNLQEYSQLVRAIQTWGLNPKEVGSIQQPYFKDADGHVFNVNNQQVQVFNFKDAAAQKQAAQQITEQGKKIASTPMVWSDDPHFWASGRMIVLYVGKDQNTIQMLTSLLGQPLQ